jgi:hypothetical protein
MPSALTRMRAEPLSIVAKRYSLSTISDIQGAFNGFAIPHKHRFIREVFDNSLSYAGRVYRTPYLHNLFRHNELILRDKRLLFVEQPVRKIN